jgi:hypothetical protein
VVPAGDASRWPGAAAHHDDPALRKRLGDQARKAVAPFTFGAWAAGMSRALGAVGAGRAC